ncbi:MAG: hypothetical protein C0601_08010 [Candidatus Muiribacterium halophilum]|uniref:Mechanosensitive ion channel protein MscS n=1 Tax=Muiribacterium halophilum TaxID=2053465 RepID=A0A2N5ZF47_MUIH1|nr:MAG: hypothetical protein C0601_08010 [Candidatus Muirbacterium halophilum]
MQRYSQELLLRVRFYLESYGIEFLKTTVVAVILIFVASKIRRFLRHYGNRFKDARDTVFNIIGDIIYFITIFSVIMLYFDMFGVNIRTIIAGMGLTGFVLGMALKDTLSNLISGFIILFSKPFSIGQTISLDGKTGLVEEINLRYVVLNDEKQVFLIPTAKAFSSTITIIK